MAQSALERHWPTLRTPTLHGHPVLRRVCFVPGKRKPAVTFSQNSTGLILGGGGEGIGSQQSSLSSSIFIYTRNRIILHGS